MVFKRIDGIVGCAYHLYLIPSHQSTGGKFGSPELFRTDVVDFPGCLRTQQLLHAEGRFKFQMGPVIEGIAHGIWHGFDHFSNFSQSPVSFPVQ